MKHTLKDMAEALDAARYGDGKSIIFRPSGGNTFLELDYALTKKAFDEIVRKVPMVEAGLDEFSACEKVLFQLFVFHTGYGQDAIYGEKPSKKG